MFRPVARAVVRASNSTSSTSALGRIPTRRWASTGANKPRSWKSGVARWGLAGAIVYYYNTNTLFADDGSDQHAHTTPPSLSDDETANLPTLDSYAKKPALPRTQSPGKITEDSLASSQPSDAPSPQAGGAADLEAEAGQQGAFNEETGEINWDCPCLGGMANGPCGEDFRAAFSCFVYSKEEPKGVECIDRFKNMQDCFRRYPEIYGAELDDDEEGAYEGDGQEELAVAKEKVADGVDEAKMKASEAKEDVTAKASEAKEEVKAKTSDATDLVKATVTSVKESVQDTYASAKDKASQQFSNAKAEADKQYASAKADSETNYAGAKAGAEKEYAAAKSYASDKASTLKSELASTTSAIREKVGGGRATSARDDVHTAPSGDERSARQESGEVSESESLVPKAAHDARE